MTLKADGPQIPEEEKVLNIMDRILDEKIVTGSMSHTVSSSYLSGDFNLAAPNLVTMDTHLKIINTASDGQREGVWQHNKILRIFSEARTCNKIDIKQLNNSPVGINKRNDLRYKTNNPITQFYRDQNIGTGKIKCGYLKDENESNSANWRQRQESNMSQMISASFATAICGNLDRDDDGES